MTKLPIAPIRNIFKENGADRVSAEALKVAEKAIRAYAQELANESTAIAKHAGRKTVKAEDVEFIL